MEKFFQLLSAGIALGGIYALVALGFVVVYKATGTFNFAQGGFVLLGAYLVYQFGDDWSLPFFVALLLAMAFMAGLAAGIERVVIRPMITGPPFTLVLITLGILLIIEQMVRTIWTQPALILTTPWGNGVTEIGGVSIRHVDLWTVVFTSVILGLFFAMFRFTTIGVAMRATSFDQEAAAAQGIKVGRSFSISWAIAGAVAVVAGVMLASRTGSAITPGLSFVALRAFPAMIIGGLDSTGGAVAGGVLIGVVEVMTLGYVDFAWVGSGFEVVVVYVLMIAVLLWRPNGLFGTKAVERV
jgi:branched-chain amino acid transport system permease protein